MSRRSFARIAAVLARVRPLLITFAAVAAGPQEKAPPPVRLRSHPATPLRRISTAARPAKPPPRASREAATAAVDELIGSYDLKPHPLPTIPDDPPPHEGAMIDQPFPVEPPDMLDVEVIEALPGRPISGERLVQPDGTIDLGFYGQVHVRGLTPIQAKVAIIKHLRKYLPDEVLGLVTSDDDGPPPEPNREPLPPPGVPRDQNPFDDPDKGNAAPVSAKAAHLCGAQSSTP